MRASILLTIVCFAVPDMALAAPPLHVRVGHVHDSRAHMGRAASYLVREHILTPAQLACSSLVSGPLSSARVSEVGVYERHGGVCPGDPQPPTFLFDLYVDTVSGVVDYTTDSQAELKTILPAIPAED